MIVAAQAPATAAPPPTVIPDDRAPGAPDQAPEPAPEPVIKKASRPQTPAHVRAAAQQHEVSSYNDEQKSGGWAILNLRTQWSDSRWQLRGGIENLFNKNYHDHLAGINRVNDGDVGVGDAIPSAGRFGYVEARYYW